MNPDLSRRRMLASAAALGTAALAGCSTDAIGRDGSADETAPEPRPPDGTLAEAGWERFKTAPVEEETTADAPLGREVTVTASGTNYYYEDARLRRRVRERTFGAVDEPLRVFFAGKLALDPNLLGAPFDVGSERVLDVVQRQAESSYERELSEMGLEGFSLVEESTLDVATGEEARLRRYESTYPYDDYEVPVTENSTHTVEGGELRYGSLLALWERDDRVLVAGGSYPGENYATTEQVDVMAGVTATVDIDLELAPDEYRADLRDLVARVE
ncbi:hypothetical protein G9464_01725 [Halostella sp. JP-L12]|uniref:DUF6517 family protein n=1 Tax=Halostella TaxID=1843185 RepID=UPI000EF7E985|nr:MULTISPECIES: DUF6517 family protein [Halostella]NHN46319.1 hypothetical protein [Halostella sp. JP-L12]